MKNKHVVVAIAGAMSIGLALGYGLSVTLVTKQSNTTEAESTERKALYYRNPMNPAITSPVPAQDEMGMDYIPVYADDDKPQERKALYYRNPMNPAITSPVPAQDEMGMDYIPVYADDSGDQGTEPTGTVMIDPVTVQNIGVRTTVATEKALSRSIRAIGHVDYNEETMVRVHPKVEGWVETLYIKKTGEPVKRGEKLLSIYSPELVSTQQEYLLALNSQETLKDSHFEDIRQGAEALVHSARERLALMDVPSKQLEELEQSRQIKKALHLHSSSNGIVLKIGVREGQYVTPKTQLYMLADLTQVWVYVDVFENELPWIAVGNPALMRVAAVPRQVFEGKVAYIYPYMESKTRTVRVRLEFDNSKLQLKPDMFANVTLQAERQDNAVVVPSEAIVRSGSREQVFVVRDSGKFEPREVTLGFSANGLTQVIDGVSAGEHVVTSSQFLIDSESKLREATAKMMEALAANDHAADDMAMDDMSIDDMNMGDMDMGDMDMGDMDMSDMNMDAPQ